MRWNKCHFNPRWVTWDGGQDSCHYPNGRRYAPVVLALKRSSDSSGPLKVSQYTVLLTYYILFGPPGILILLPGDLGTLKATQLPEISGQGKHFEIAAAGVAAAFVPTWSQADLVFRDWWIWQTHQHVWTCLPCLSSVYDYWSYSTSGGRGRTGSWCSMIFGSLPQVPWGEVRAIRPFPLGISSCPQLGAALILLVYSSDAFFWLFRAQRDLNPRFSCHEFTICSNWTDFFVVI